MAVSEEVKKEIQAVRITGNGLVHDIRAAILISSAMGAMESIRQMEPAKHTKKYRQLSKIFKEMNALLDMFPRANEYDLIKLASDFYDGMDDKLNRMIIRGLAAHGDVVKCIDRWKRGDVLKKGKAVAVVHTICEEGYHVVSGPALLYSDTNWPKDPFMILWEKVGELGEGCTDKDISGSVWVQGARL